MTFSAKQIADYLQGEVIGNPNVQVHSFAKIEEGKPGTITFLSNPKYTHYIYKTQADIVLVNSDFVPEKPIKATMIKVPNAYTALASLLEMVEMNSPKKTGIDVQSAVASSAQLGKNVYIGAFAVVEENAEIGDNCQIYPQVYIGNNVKIGENTIIYPGVKIYKDCIIGSNCIIHSGAVIGAEGFGFSREKDGYRKVPQTGNVVIENDVEIGANTTIDRSVIGSTIIHQGVKLDNLIHIAHNCEIGENTVMAAQVGIAGSSKIGENCVFGGQVGIGGHVTIGDDSQIGGQSGILSNTEKGSRIIGTPAIPVKNYFRSSVLFARLPDMDRQLRALEKEIEELKKKLAEK